MRNFRAWCVLAAVFGVGPVVNAYSCASIILAHFLALLGALLLDAFATGLSTSGSSGAVTRDLAILQVAISSRMIDQSAGSGPCAYFGKLRNVFEDEGVREVFSVLLPATVASGLLQIATFADLYLASFIPGAAAGLGYANLLVMAPLGILSSAI
ncbi:hypothetical protein R1sor_011018 [Riccia sorocarpa]|uniref:ABC transmembrane type-1 domain-containing protein n=1 Tax=Riccia sorocarpa TaxID=122646 RepID=A0ABD3I3E8_9MARC